MSRADLFLYEQDQFVLKRQGVTPIVQKRAKCKYCLSIQADGAELLNQPLSNSMYFRFRKDKCNVVWQTPPTPESATKTVLVWSLRFAEEGSLMVFVKDMARGLNETSSGVEMSATAQKDLPWIIDGYNEDVQMADSDASEPEDMDFDEDLDSSDDEFSATAREKNTALAVGYKQRSFVARGNKIGAFKHTDDGDLKYVAMHSLTDPAAKGDNALKPDHVMLHKQDNSLLMLDPDKKTSVFHVDLNRPDIVENWSLGDYRVNELLQNTKMGQQQTDDTFMGLNGVGFFRVDPRLPGEKTVADERFSYTGKVALSCGATTGTGQLVVGSEKGNIRLYSANLNTRAKTELPGLGDPIVGVDTTESGQWVVATTQTYLLVFSTLMEDGSNGFNSRMGSEKPAPRRLQLKPEDLARVGIPDFTRAYFDQRKDGESFIITSTGNWVVTWNFRKVKRGVLTDYKLIQYEDTIVDKHFQFGPNANVVALLPDDVKIAHRKK
eukprot:TRINITY_DN3265_c0_g1_i1.p1 TRINITY_DN3265_c0_g1~~TRINITY_DN3265_c0_g1_i1.p1  ORF type:complete len:494 (+),score=97.79 TRINITY_DN3265_c0_g1_i1:95-1576(+)